MNKCKIQVTGEETKNYMLSQPLLFQVVLKVEQLYNFSGVSE